MREEKARLQLSDEEIVGVSALPKGFEIQVALGGRDYRVQVRFCGDAAASPHAEMAVIGRQLWLLKCGKTSPKHLQVAGHGRRQGRRRFGRLSHQCNGGEFWTGPWEVHVDQISCL